MVYEKVRKNASSWSPAFHQEKSESLFRSRPFSIPAEADTEEAEEQAIPAYSRFDRDAISANLLRTMGANVQSQVEVEGQKPQLESEEKTDEMSADAEMLQRQSESPEAGDDENSSNGGTIQRQEEPAQPEDDEELSSQAGTVQLQEEPAPSEDDEMQPVQTKLTIGAPGDKYEQEADQMAARVMSMDTANPQSIQRQSEGEEEEIQRSPLAASITPLIQRFSEEDVQTKPSVQRAGKSAASQAGTSLESRLSSQKGGGSALDDEVRSFMEPRFGNDFSGVRIHTGSNAVQMNKELHAQAFTHGSDIYFNAGKYNPGSNEGKQLLAHELTHVVQQTGAKTLQQKPITTRLNNRETSEAKALRLQPTEEEPEQPSVQRQKRSGHSSELTLNKELRRQPLEVEQAEEEQETVQAKLSPDDAFAVASNKEQQSQIPEEEEEKQPLPTQPISRNNPEHPLGQGGTRTNKNVKVNSEKTVAETQPRTNVQETAPKTELTSEPKAEKSAVEPQSAGAETASLTPEGQTELTPKPVVPETGENVGAKAGAEKASAQGKSASNQGAVPQTEAGTPVPAEAAQQVKPENTPDTQPGTEAITAAPIPAAQGTATAPAVESGGGATEESVGVPAAGGEEEEVAALAAEAPPGSAELEASERDVALASLAQDAGGGGGTAGGGGGGSGTAIPDQPTPSVPDVSQSEPSAALAAVNNLPPAQLQAALGGVSAAVGNSVGQQRAELAANPPQMESPSGSPKTSEGSAADREAPAAQTPKAVEKAPEGAAKPVPEPKPLPPLPAPPTAAVPQVKGDAEGKLDAGDAERLKASLSRMPTTDPGLQVSAGAPPALELQGDADPKQAQEQQAKLEKSVTEAHTQGKQDLAQPMGENEIYPQVQPETLRAEVTGGGASAGGGVAVNGAGGAAAAGEGAAGNDAVSIIAQQEKGQEIQSAVAQAQSQVAAQRQEHAVKVAEEKARSNAEISQLQQENAAQQAQERAKAQTEVTKLRSDWQTEQDALVDKSRKDANEAVSKANEDVQNEQTQAETKAAEHIQQGEEKAAEERRKGEQEAEKEQQKGEKESGGILGWFADKAKAFFDGIKQAIQKAFEVARAAVKAAIEGAKKLATAVIETARKAIVGIIKAVGEALIAIGDVLLAAFPGLRDRFRNAIKAAVKAAETAVNALANTLKQGVLAALNLLGKGLDAALGLLEKGLLAAVDIASKAVQGAIKFADAAIKALGAFAVLAKDIAASPGQWLSNLGGGANDGIRNHFWGAFQTAVKEWFSQKVEEVLGLGMTVWNVLKQGGINTAEVGKMAWEGIKSAIPAVLIGILIEKVVSMIVPAAGTVLLIIEGLQAAWGTVSRIVQAFERFMAFLKAVKTGQAGPPFGAAVAAAGVVVIDFVSNWLLKRLRGPASKVAGKIKEIAKKIGNKVKKVAKKLGKKFGKLKDKVFGKKGKKDRKRDKDKANKSADRAKLKKAADKAAKAGWNKARKASSKEVISSGKLESILNQAGNSKGKGIHVTLSAVPQGENWSVKAVAQGEGGSATANAGRGAILRDPQQRPWYSANSLDGLSKKLINEAVQKLTAQTQPKESGDLQQEYQEKRRLARKLEQDGTRQLNQKVHGVRMTITMEPFSGAEKDKQIKTKITVAPNTETHELQVPLTGSDADFKALEEKLNAEVVGKRYNLPDLVILYARRAARKVKFKKVDWKRDTDPVTGDYIDTLVFHHPTEKGKSQSWVVAKVAGDNNCPACGNAIAQKPPQKLANDQAQNPNVDVRDGSRPHFFLNQGKLNAALKNAVDTIETHYNPGPDAPAYATFKAKMQKRKELDKLVGARTPAALSGRKNSSVTNPDQQMQCHVCERGGSHNHGSFSLKERLENTKTPNALPSGADKNAHVGNQVGGIKLSKKDEKELTTQRLHFQVYPYVQNVLTGITFWPAGMMSRFGGDRNKQIAEFMRAFKAAIKAYR